MVRCRGETAGRHCPIGQPAPSPRHGVRVVRLHPVRIARRRRRSAVLLQSRPYHRPDFALLAFSAGFIVRPLGAPVFGRSGDRIGRKYTFLVTILVMGLATFLERFPANSDLVALGLGPVGTRLVGSPGSASYDIRVIASASPHARPAQVFRERLHPFRHPRHGGPMGCTDLVAEDADI